MYAAANSDSEKGGSGAEGGRGFSRAAAHVSATVSGPTRDYPSQIRDMLASLRFDAGRASAR